jgi:FkbM family methyltransferase
VDVGANIGTHALYALRLEFERAICIEPDPANFRLLRTNQVLNDMDARCMNVLAAASDQNGSAILELSPSNFGDHRVRTSEKTGNNLHGEDQWETSCAHVRRLDDIISDLGVDFTRLGLVWIDTQGHEGHVLSGAPIIVSLPAPKIVEFWPYGLARASGYPLLRSILSSRGGSIYDLRRSIETDAPHRMSLHELDLLYEHYLTKESAALSPHTDLLLV